MKIPGNTHVRTRAHAYTHIHMHLISFIISITRMIIVSYVIVYVHVMCVLYTLYLFVILPHTLFTHQSVSVIHNTMVNNSLANSLHKVLFR